jgi:hypothetical protein
MASPTNSMQDRNRELARQINEEALADPGSRYAGKFVGIVRGQVAVVAENLNDLGRELRRMSAAPSDTFCLEAGHDYEAVYEIWSEIG